jgi:pimeloyl-ACP methyl ester carboxylesterase
MHSQRLAPRQPTVALGLLGTFVASLAAAAAPAPAGPACASSAWTGTVSYQRLQSTSSSKTVPRVSGRGEDRTDFEMSYDYKALVAVTASPDGRGSVGKATVRQTSSSKETTVAKETNSCDRGKSWQEMTGTFTNETTTTGTGNDFANVTIGVNDDGTYQIGVAAPRIRGRTSSSSSSSFSGQCSKKEGKTSSTPEIGTGIEGGSLVSDGRNRIDPHDPTKLSGSYSKTVLGATQTITWNLQRCAAPLRLVDLKFEDMKFPKWDDWHEITEQVGTIDGNWVRVRATVFNGSAERRTAEVMFKETYQGDKWDAARKDQPLKDQSFSIALEPGEAREVEMLWDSSGYAWYDDGRPRLVQRVKAELWEKYQLVNDLTRNLKIAPKPLVLLHGAWAHWKTFETWQNILTTSHSYDWKAFPVGEVTNRGILNTGRDFFSDEETNSTPQNAEALRNYIQYAQEDRNAWHVDVLGHSVGGLIARYYISHLMPAAYPDGRPQISHLLMLGTPNLGSPCADVMDFAFNMTGKSPRVIHEMRQDAMAGFNKANASRNGVKFAALAGNPLPTMCRTIVWNDGFVPVPSAHWTIADHAISKDLSFDLPNTANFSSFVKPHVAIGPRGDHNPDLPGVQGYRSDAHGDFIHAAYRPQLTSVLAPAETLKPDFAKAVTFAPKQVVEVPIPVANATNFGITFMAAREISATLYDDKGAIVGRNLAGTPEAGATFRSVFVDKAVTAGTWKLRLESTSAQQRQAVIAAWTNAVTPDAKGGLVALR